MIDKLNIIQQRFNELSDLIIQPSVISDQKKYIKISREYKELNEIIDKKSEYELLLANINEANEIIKEESDKEMIELANSELEENKKKIILVEEDLKIMLIPKDPDDSKNVVMELRAGTGGDEASIFAGDLFRMYSKYSEKRGWKLNLVDLNEGTAGGFKEIIFEINGQNVYGTLKYESGVHRVQRVPQTETQGRVHTSAATVMVLPEAEEFDVELHQQVPVVNLLIQLILLLNYITNQPG
jgi:peptide chain release factor 1